MAAASGDFMVLADIKAVVEVVGVDALTHARGVDGLST